VYVTSYIIHTIEIDTLEYQQTENIETELKDVDRIRIRKVYACCPGLHSGGGHKSAPVSHKHMLSQPSFRSPLINEDLPAGPQLVFTLNNRFFRHQARYSLLPAKPGGQADRVISLCKYKVVDPHTQVTALLLPMWRTVKLLYVEGSNPLSTKLTFKADQ
jgi:hypothetical protein